MRGHSQLKEVFVGKSISDNAILNLSDGFPIGRGYRRLILDLHLALTRSSGSSAVADADQKFLRSLSFSDNRGNVYAENIPGCMIYRRNRRLNGVGARRTDIAASTATYSTLFILDFTDPRLARPDDTIVDSQDVEKFTLSLSFGAIGDLLTVNGDTLATTLDCYVDQTADVLPRSGNKGAVAFVQSLSMLPQVDPASYSSLDVPGRAGEYLKRLHILTCNSGSAYPCAGSPAANILAKLQLRSNKDQDYRETLVGTLSGLNKTDYQEETISTGFYTMDLVKGGSIMEAMPTQDSQTQLVWTTDTLSTSRVNVLQERILARK